MLSSLLFTKDKLLSVLHVTPFYTVTPFSSSFFPKGRFQPFFGSVTSRTTRRAQRHGLPPSDQGWNESG